MRVDNDCDAQVESLPINAFIWLSRTMYNNKILVGKEDEISYAQVCLDYLYTQRWSVDAMTLVDLSFQKYQQLNDAGDEKAALNATNYLCALRRNPLNLMAAAESISISAGQTHGLS